MRRRCVLAAIAALVAAPAAAASLPPIGSGQQAWRGATHTIVLGTPQRRSPLSCSAHAVRSLGWLERKLQPVACEQPPRSNLLVRLPVPSVLLLADVLAVTP
jgi:hypothetical protein